MSMVNTFVGSFNGVLIVRAGYSIPGSIVVSHSCFGFISPQCP